MWLVMALFIAAAQANAIEQPTTASMAAPRGAFSCDGHRAVGGRCEAAITCWPDSAPVMPAPVPSASVREHSLGQQGGFRGRTDVLQVVAAVAGNCILNANVAQIASMHPPGYVHVIVTPDTTGCEQLRSKWSHVRCLGDSDVLGVGVSVASIQSALAAVGEQSRAKGAAWFLQQMLKMGAVALGVGGLGEHVRIMDGDSVTLRPSDWFTAAGNEIFDTCDRDTLTVGDGLNHVRYGALWYNLTGLPLVGSPALIAHGMSTRRTHMRTLLQAMSPPGRNWRSAAWVAHSLGRMCDYAAVTGFSEYYYYASWVLGRSANETAAANGSALAAPPLVRVPQVCQRFSAPPHTGDGTPAIKIASYLAAKHPTLAYVVIEDHASRKRGKQSS